MKRTQLLLATGNSGKLREISALLCDLPFALLSLADFPGINVVPETGSTFAENASLKASGYSRQAGVLTLADDSGLEIDALGGAPGVLSARYLGEHSPYSDRISALLTKLKSMEGAKRSARFVCAVSIASADGVIIRTTQASCEGHVAHSPRGSGGFGYDPIFVPDGFGQTFAELPAELKNQISHRGKALSAARQFLASLTVSSTGG